MSHSHLSFSLSLFLSLAFLYNSNISSSGGCEIINQNKRCVGDTTLSIIHFISFS